MTRRTVTRLALIWLPMIICMAVIFIFSSQDGAASNQLSQNVTQEFMVKEVFSDFQAEAVSDGLNYMVRKMAHLILFFLLGLSVLHALLKNSFTKAEAVRIGMLICIIYACLDEVHQLFVQGRDARWQDVLIDTAGASVGFLTFWITTIISRFVQEINNRKCVNK